MNSTDKPTIPDVFLNVRKAYRLLHDYQRMVLDGVRYIEAQLDIPHKGGWTRFFSDEAVKDGNVDLGRSSWEWLPMMWYEFHFLKQIEPEKITPEYLVLSLFIISDTGWIEGDVKVEDIDDPFGYMPAEQSSSKFIFILRKTNEWRENFPFIDKKVQMRDFIKEGGFLPDELLRKGYVGKCYHMSCLTSESEANKVVGDIIDFAKEKSWPLEYKKK
jgi:hypothetical protein